jgi:hypothetical protein
MDDEFEDSVLANRMFNVALRTTTRRVGKATKWYGQLAT